MILSIKKEMKLNIQQPLKIYEISTTDFKSVNLKT